MTIQFAGCPMLDNSWRQQGSLGSSCDSWFSCSTWSRRPFLASLALGPPEIYYRTIMHQRRVNPWTRPFHGLRVWFRGVEERVTSFLQCNVRSARAFCRVQAFLFWTGQLHVIRHTSMFHCHQNHRQKISTDPCNPALELAWSGGGVSYNILYMVS